LKTSEKSFILKPISDLLTVKWVSTLHDYRIRKTMMKRIALKEELFMFMYQQLSRFWITCFRNRNALQ